ncbi:MAG: hypothetical protein FWH57_09890 [Oscillospiraceae bacterium]|nr:hypothetical protein [Oscillospiraceae bacterium]
MNDVVINVMGFIFFYAASYGICILFCKNSPEKSAGHIRINMLVEIILVLRPCKYGDNEVHIYSLIHQMLLQIGLMTFLSMIIVEPSEPARALRVFSGIFIATVMTSFFGRNICRMIYIKKNNNNNNN